MGVWNSGYISHTGIGVTWRWYSDGTQQPCSLSLQPTQHLVPSSIQTSGQHIGEFKPLSNVAAHGVVNDSLHFIEPVTGVHTQHVESYWSRVKTKLKHMRGCHAHQLPSYLDEFLWRERFGQTTRDTLNNIMGEIAQQYPRVRTILKFPVS